MLLKDRAGPVSDQQRRLLEEAEKACTRLSALVAEMSDLAHLEGGTSTINRSAVDLGAVIQDAIAGLPPLPEREVAVELDNGAPGATVQGDPVRLRSGFTAVLTALRRELVTSTELLIRLQRATEDGEPVLRAVIADGDRADAVDGSRRAELAAFDEWRGGCGLSLAVARRVFTAHGGRISSPAADAKAGAVIELPELKG